ncbi:MAG TPA: ATP-binding protein, partial [Chitinophagaceae bacterium]|nr:ATP-binding protein [Chitinophagaceae bacterium]
DTALLLFEQITELGIKPRSCGFLIMDEETKSMKDWSANLDEKGEASIVTGILAYDQHPILSNVVTTWRKRVPYFIGGIHGKDLQEYYKMVTSKETTSKAIRDKVLAKANSEFTNSFYFGYGMMYVLTPKAISDQEIDIMLRFAKVFEQTYTRFLDLKKAEEQAREAEIQLALERVRARTMAMHSSNELTEVASELFQQITALGLKPSAYGVVIVDEKEKTGEVFITADGTVIPDSFVLPYHGEPAQNKIFNSWKKREPYTIVDLKGKKLESHLSFIAQNMPVRDMLEASGTARPDRLALHMIHFKHGFLGINYLEPNEEVVPLLIRFAKVFEQTYTRFLDLQKAEAQAREAQIEASLERIRSRTMGMQVSTELKEIVALLYEECNKFGFASFLIILNTRTEKEDGFNWWLSTSKQTVFPQSYYIPDIDEPVFEKIRSIWRSGKPSGHVHMSGKIKAEHDRRLFSETGLKELPGHLKEKMISDKSISLSIANMKNGFIEVADKDFIAEDQMSILIRYAKVFEQTYSRFLDLQKAEAQARESQIEAALERVRSRSLAMHHSSELSAVVETLLSEFTKLEFTLTFCIINLINEQDRSNTVWAANPETGKQPESYYMKFEDYPFHHAMWKAWKNQEKRFIYTIEGEEKKIYDEYLYTDTEFRRFPKHVQDANKALERYVAGFTFFKYSGLQTVSENFISEEDLAILERFGRVFEQSYTRFLDLQKAEAQAREAKIEAALEKVRSRSLAMHSADELQEVVLVIVEKLQELGVILDANGITLCTYFPGSRDVQHWIASPDFTHVGKYLLPYFDHVIFSEAWHSKESGDPYFSKEYSGEEKNSFFKHAFEHSDYRNFPGEVKQWILENDKHVLSFAWQKNSAILIPSNTGLVPTEAEKEILIRFSKVFEQAYVRFMDLQRAEAQAREAEIQLALERVRARTMAMHNSSELAEVAVLLFEQIKHLGVKSFSSGFNIWDDEYKNLISWMSNATGEINPPFELPIQEYEQHQRIFTAWKKKELFLEDDLQGEALTRHYKFLRSFPLLDQSFKQAEQAGIKIPDRQVHNVAFFSNGYLLFITDEPTPQYHLIFQRFGKVFDQTYTRFLDLKRAEAQALQAENDLVEIKAARKKAEEALKELQVTQKQLIQSEKMASLGELTAGIAHEIQNPLNFVNNFSDVSNELIQEMKEELEKGNTKDAVAIAEDVRQNLEKILQHGKRADGIVKGMLQHSRSSSGQKELTDINVLVEEYLRLAFHGLRAKDKSFNAKFETHFEENIEKLNIVPQDIGRVILNLINNAFYAVNEKLNAKRLTQNAESYEPTVVVSTKKDDEKVIISVKDNGNGIPDAVKDKIFQPFFTTKPTGEGTGLGLSLSYDIIKAHAGEFTVETKEEEGTIFTINIPVNQ